MSVQVEAVKVLRRLVGDVHRYIEHITLAAAPPLSVSPQSDPASRPVAPPPSAPLAVSSLPIQLALLHDDVLLERFHFDRATIAYLCSLLRPHVSNTWMQVEGTVCAALAFYTTGAFQSPMGDCFEIDPAVVRNVVELVSDALVTVSDQFIKFPSLAVQKQVQQDFLSVAGFPGVVGALGCTHIAIRRPEVNPNLYVNRKHFYSMNLQITTTADCRITSAVARFPGSFSCAHVLQHSPLEALCSKGGLGKGHLIAHSGYPLHQWLLPPLQNAQTKADVRYNEALRQSHAVVGRTVRLLKARFPCLDRAVLPLQCSPRASARVILACCVLHNIALLRDVKLPGHGAGALADLTALAHLPSAHDDYNCESDDEALSDSEEIVALRVTAGQEKQAFTIQQFFA
ncbi:putative nuclease HARBI1 [Megalops cyprinoides]|uniref:putative nuclease HARBI1 n=1 Tax=Megalops cyprinoides TaxID=118141 RepID=UPI001864A668|nr:putative nuclease HARBI1 [Megalops cyprinoides]